MYRHSCFRRVSIPSQLLFINKVVNHISNGCSRSLAECGTGRLKCSKLYTNHLYPFKSALLPHHTSVCQLCSTSTILKRMEKSWPKVVLFGDSLTQYGYSKDGCWSALVADYLQRKCDVISRGFSGYNTRWCKIILPKVITSKDTDDVKLVTIFLGANDSVDSTLCSKQHVPLEEFKQNLKDMVQYLQDIGVARQKIIIISPPPCDEQKWEADCKEKGRVFGKYNTPTKVYAAACKEVAVNVGTQFVDIYTSMSNQKNWENMLNDGLHFSTLGSEFVFDQLKPLLDKLTSDLPLQMPYWADIDNDSPHTLLDAY